MTPTAGKLDGVDPDLRSAARFIPQGLGLHRGLMLPRVVMGLLGRTGRIKGVPVASVAPGVSVRLHRNAARAEPGPALLWIHGGGTVMGSAAQDDQFCRRLARDTGVDVVAVDHRLAPEHPFPAPVEDCYTALRWLARQPWADADRIAIGGQSAGGGFAAALAMLARDRQEIQPVLQMLVYPMLDDSTGARGDWRKWIMWSARDNQVAWQFYLAQADPDIAVPARRADLDGLPPAWIGVGSLDLFHQESIAYAERLRAAGVPAHVEVAEGGYHGFDLIVPNAPASRRFFESQSTALVEAVNTRP